MKIAITGHTSGIGLAVAEHLATNHFIVGFSRTTGYDISTGQGINDIVAQCNDVDVIVNNAYRAFSQVDLLYALHAKLSDRKLLIINNSSQSSDGIKKKPWIYSVHKAALDKASEQLSYQDTACKISNLRMGYVDIPRMANITQPKISTKSVCAAIDFIISQWLAGHCVKELTLLP